MKEKDSLLKEINNREVLIFFATDINKIIVKRKTKDEFIKLNPSNYDNIISGRTISICSTMKEKEKFGIIDLDFHDFNTNKNATFDIYDELLQINKNLEIIYTGKNGFHIYYHFNSFKDINLIRQELQEILKRQSEKYSIHGKRSLDRVNLDLSPNKFRGAYTTINSLSTIGLKCMRITRDHLDDFIQNEAKI
jgi:hypothetical protein